MSSPARHVVWLDDDDATEPSLTGSKFAVLAQLRRWPVHVRPVVPDGFVLSTEAWRRVAAHNGLGGSRPTASELRGATLPTDLLAELEAALTELGRRAGEPSWAVRSSSPLEDGPRASHAGQFTSVLGVRGVDAVIAAYRRCCASAVGVGIDEYRRRTGFAELAGTQMAVIVQPMVHDGDGFTGVVFSENPADPGTILIEAVRGTGDLLGRTDPERHVVPREAVAADAPLVGSAAAYSLPADALPADALPADALPAHAVGQLGRWALAAQERLGAAVDVEFAIDPGGHVQILQLRPVTGSPTSERHRVHQVGPASVTGLAVRSGRAEGRVCRVDGPEQFDLLEEGDVLVTQATDPSWLPLLGRVAAVVTDHGGLTSHAAIVCRELGLLAVVGCGDATSVLEHGRRVVVTGDTTGRGSVEQFDQH